MAARKKITAPVIGNWANLTEKERTEAIKNHPRWYQENYESKKLREAFFDFAKRNLSEKDYALVRAGTPFITDLDGALAMCVADGYDFAPYISRLLDKRVPAILSYVNEEKKRKKELDKILGRAEAKGKPKVFTIQERIAEQTRHIIGHIEGEIDTFLADGCKKPKFDAKKFLRMHEVKAPQAKLILEFLETNIEELKLVLARKDDQLREGYAFLTKAKQKKYYDFLVSIQVAVNERIDSVKKTRKPRKKKAKSPAQLTASVKYLEKSEDGKLTSIDPANIIGARQVWLYNTNDRFLFVYNSDYGLSMKGSTIKDFDAETSIKKKLREQYTDAIIDDILNGGKVKLRKIMPGIRAKDGAVTGRINKHMIILRAVK